MRESNKLIPKAIRSRKTVAQLVQDTLDAKDWNIAKTAEALGVSRGTIYHHIHRLDLKPKERVTVS